MNLNASQLPPPLRNMLKAAGLNWRKVYVTTWPEGQAVQDGSIVATLNGRAREVVPFVEGGGCRARSKVIAVRGFGGTNYIGIAAPAGVYTFKTIGEIAVAIDAALEAA